MPEGFDDSAARTAGEIDAVAYPLRPHYARFLAGTRFPVWLTGHSHQAWPDVSREAQLLAWDDAARLCDDKWDRVLGEIIPSFQRHIAKRIGSGRAKDIVCGTNTHELVFRLLSCFGAAPRIVTTDDEFHSLRRQLVRLEQDGAHVTWVPVEDGADFVERMITTIRHERPELVMFSLVFFTTSLRVDHVETILAEAVKQGATVLVDAYHAMNACEFFVDAWPSDNVFVVGGGYKYAESGEGAAWMLLPKNACAYSPRFTGWLADFATLDAPRDGTIRYGDDAARFLGATFDPTGLYRAVRVFDFMDAMGLCVSALCAQSKRQIDWALSLYDQLGLHDRGVVLRTPRDPARRGAFIALEVVRPRDVLDGLRQRGVRMDARGACVRMGPAPYTLSAEIERGMRALGDVVGVLGA